jgi:hypothetical protein
MTEAYAAALEAGRKLNSARALSMMDPTVKSRGHALDLWRDYRDKIQNLSNLDRERIELQRVSEIGQFDC